MARIAGVDIPSEKRVEIALTYIKGIGRSLSNKILKEVEISPDARVKNLTEGEISRIKEALEKGGYRLEGELTQEVALNIKRLRDIGSYRGIRHEKGLPVRGQRTRTNARTRKGRKIAVGGTSRAALKAMAARKT
ncbi:30S ribosomal protein S13 [candidate division WWE3 bacterium CG09_land_8_20_14_0_10_47_33]|uniref:Small ribosomal subunit protein uS13 n=1 Tax=candidate division WWE3 bacterium CG_4_9_14_0_2_um_filter_48_10 TaxID=1975078 RepID=A0A2M8EJU4_UNCKA|nr:MAG: 30S ribosomal protein S13 [candidate division WWE3 bacterium CG09_land_8_20_14_0_10_47_33]PIZ41481.1 MAG: 30S ribosomal protein S13 [candidate division WWE3 bacterium CG_4_10_14_0_2_um_filter_47_8]PJC22978.1 MAG: 30S ribosomal protein S13 [candidate division WWE3 bacterium CG_4_9_14_0_2_um_filter_48_10]PJE51220.1 MAG: 30S ribosomal protein S13 [candidate division WWE3 bacterium CG10_big_fil_rev_8_21_14_0_10_48_23]